MVVAPNDDDDDVTDLLSPNLYPFHYFVWECHVRFMYFSLHPSLMNITTVKSRSTDSSLDTVYEWQYTRMDMVN
jgi:hypothetical protein